MNRIGKIKCSPEFIEDILKKDTSFYGHPGLAWAARREIFDRLGFLDRIILPATDLFMLRAFYDCEEDYYNEEMDMYFPNWACQRYFIEWSEKMREIVRGSVYYTNGFVFHLWHGKLQKRVSNPLVEILRKYNLKKILELEKVAVGSGQQKKRICIN